jgi:hypothetical protein
VRRVLLFQYNLQVLGNQFKAVSYKSEEFNSLPQRIEVQFTLENSTILIIPIVEKYCLILHQAGGIF